MILGLTPCKPLGMMPGVLQYVQGEILGHLRTKASLGTFHVRSAGEQELDDIFAAVECGSLKRILWFNSGC